MKKNQAFKKLIRKVVLQNKFNNKSRSKPPKGSDGINSLAKTNNMSGVRQAIHRGSKILFDQVAFSALPDTKKKSMPKFTIGKD